MTLNKDNFMFNTKEEVRQCKLPPIEHIVVGRDESCYVRPYFVNIDHYFDTRKTLMSKYHVYQRIIGMIERDNKE